MFKPENEVYSKNVTLLDNDEQFVLNHILLTDEFVRHSNEYEEVCDRQREWMNENAQGITSQDKSGLKWLHDTLRAFTVTTILPSIVLTYD